MIGRALVAAGMLLLFYTGYLLWGTNLYTNAEQKRLASELQKAPIVTHEDASAVPGVIPPARPSTEPKPGDPLFTIVIPKIAARAVVVQGVELEELKKGPGHFVEAPWPGEDGNVAISGHRTTFGAPFFNLNQVQPGDAISIEAGPYRYRYTVSEQIVVSPRDVSVVKSRGKNELTLTTCHPRFSASQRLIVHADFAGAELIAAASPARSASGSSTAAEEEPTLVPAPPPAVPQESIVLIGVALAALLGAMALSERLRTAALWSGVTLVVCAGLWTAVFPQVLRLMPANY